MLDDLPPLLTVAEFCARTNGAVSESDPRVQPLIDAVTAAVRRWCGWHVSPSVDDVMVLDGEGGRSLTLPTLHVTEVKGLVVDGSTIDPVDFDWSESGQIMLRCGQFPDRYRSVRVTVRHGFDSVSDVTQVVQQVAANAVSSALGATREQAGGVSITWALTAPNVSGGVSLLARDLESLSAYRLPPRT